MDLIGRVLEDVHDGKLGRLPSGPITVADNTQVESHETAEYIAAVRRLIAASWVMECTGRDRLDRDGVGVRLRLTTLGELRRLDATAQRPAVTV